ncbi:MAG: hypothetical protein KJ069_22850 [Anaerolineae bacterium]|nr:hypothetical protein [Anaerolineae bacterium]
MSQTETKPLKPTLAMCDEFHQLVVRQLLGPYNSVEEGLSGGGDCDHALGGCARFGK